MTEQPSAVKSISTPWIPSVCGAVGVSEAAIVRTGFRGGPTEEHVGLELELSLQRGGAEGVTADKLPQVAVPRRRQRRQRPAQRRAGEDDCHDAY